MSDLKIDISSAPLRAASTNLLLCPRAHGHDKIMGRTAVEALELDEIIAQQHGIGIQNFQLVGVRGQGLSIVDHQTYQFLEVMGFTKRYGVEGENGFEALFNGLLCVKADGLIVDLFRPDQQIERP